MTLVQGNLRVTSGGDAEASFATGPVRYERSAHWFAQGGVSDGGLDSGSGTTLRIPVASAGDLRRLFAVEAAGMTIKRNIDPDFGWAGGSPAKTIDICKLSSPPVSSGTAYAVKVSNLWVMTDRLTSGQMTVASPALGRWYYVEGETPATFMTWDPATA